MGGEPGFRRAGCCLRCGQRRFPVSVSCSGSPGRRPAGTWNRRPRGFDRCGRGFAPGGFRREFHLSFYCGHALSGADFPHGVRKIQKSGSAGSDRFSELFPGFRGKSAASLSSGKEAPAMIGYRFCAGSKRLMNMVLQKIKREQWKRFEATFSCSHIFYSGIPVLAPVAAGRLGVVSGSMPSGDCFVRCRSGVSTRRPVADSSFHYGITCW